MKIVYFGSPEESSQVLTRLLHLHEIVAVVTNPDSPQKRSAQPVATPVAKVAAENGIPAYKFSSLKKENASEILAQYKADVFVVFSYGHIIPVEVFTIPPHGTINLHPSKLPSYRGASPVQSAIIDGLTESAISVQVISEALDAGDIVVQEKLIINEEQTAGDIMREVIERGSLLVDRAINLLADGFVPTVQSDMNISYCAKITRDSSRINWNSDAVKLHNLVRALNPKPYAWTTLAGKEIKIISVQKFDESFDFTGKNPGCFFRYQKKRLVACCGQGAIEIIQLHPEAKKLMDAPSFLNGFREEQGIFE